MAQLDTDGIEVRLEPQRLQAVIDMALEDCRDSCAVARSRWTCRPTSLPSRSTGN